MPPLPNPPSSSSSSSSSSSQLLAELACLPLPGFEGRFGIHELVQLAADARHVELGGLALLPEGGRLLPQLRGGHGELLAALAALQLHPLGVVEEGLHAHGHRFTLVLRHVLTGMEVRGQNRQTARRLSIIHFGDLRLVLCSFCLIWQ